MEVAGVEGAGEADGWVGLGGAACGGGTGGWVFCCTGAVDCGGRVEVSEGVCIRFSVPGVGALGGGRSDDA